MFVEHGRLDLADSLVIHGGWLALPLSFAVAAAIALLLRGARTLLARTCRGASSVRRKPELGWTLSGRGSARVRVIACNLAGRAPPLLVN